MQNFEKQIAQFDRYIQGQLSISERQHLDQQLRDDAALNESFNLYLKQTEGINLAGEMWLRSHFATLEQSILPNEMVSYSPIRAAANQSKKEKRWKVMSWIMIIGSALLLVAFLIAIMHLPDLEAKFSTYKTSISEETDNIQKITTLSSRSYKHMNASMGTYDYTGISMRDSAYGSSYTVVWVEDSSLVNAKRFKHQNKDSIVLYNFSCKDIILYGNDVWNEGLFIQCSTILFHLDSTFKSVNTLEQTEGLEY